MFSNCKDCQAKNNEIAELKKEVKRLKATIVSVENYCQANANRANAMLETNLGMRTYGRMKATSEHLGYIAQLLGVEVEPSSNLLRWRGFRGFLS